MIEELGLIVDVKTRGELNNIWVETEIKTTCNACQVQKNCGTSVIAKTFANKTQRLNFETDLPVKIGQKIKIGIPEERLLSASILVYLLPVLGLIVGSLAAEKVLPLLSLSSEIWVILSGFIMASVVFVSVRYYLKRVNQQHFCPQLLGLMSDEPDLIEIKQL